MVKDNSYVSEILFWNSMFQAKSQLENKAPERSQ